MQRHLSNVVWSISKAFGLLAGLAACAPPPAYLDGRLDTVPTPKPALMAKTSAPDCKVGVAPVLSSAAKEETTSDFESEVDGATASASPARIQAASGEQDGELKRLARERDCYRRAEQIARQQLEALQASFAQTMVALDRIRSDGPDTSERPGW
ncbi:MAG: hypothetical protein MPJ78_11505 [Hyphomicrobiaceae bacterium]|nr:hypothetical protein [Hyphomicrobiaceae bacterium]